MKASSSLQSRRSGLRLLSSARALPTVLALAALAVTTRSLAQAPTFNTVIMTQTGSAPWQQPRPAAVGDFNGDGKLDALIVDGTPALRFMRGNGNGTFARTDIGVASITTGNAVDLHPNLVPYLPNNVDGYVLIKAADVNGDGRLDAICVTTTHINWGPYSFVTVMINTGNDAGGTPQFAATHYYLGFYDVRSLTAGDLTGDGKAEFIVGSAYAGLYVYRNNGSGTFTRSQVTSLLPNAGGPAVGIGVIADMNGDGKADFVVTSGQANATDLFLGNGDGTLQAPVIVSPAATTIEVADLNNDGKKDLIEGLADGSVAVYLGNGNGTFGSPTSFPNGTSSWVSGFFVSDVNGDGKLDVAASLYSAGKVAILTGNGDGTLGAANLYSGIPNASDVTLADFTGDGKPEIASVSAGGYGGQNFGVFTNTTVFAPPLPTQTLTILGGSGSVGAVAANVEYYNSTTGNWQPAFLSGGHPWGFVNGTNSWINYKVNNSSDAGAGPTTNQTRWYLYRVRFTVPADAQEPKMTFSLKADNFAQVAINGVTAGGSAQYINYTNMNNVVVGAADQVNVDAVFSQNVHPGENTITLNIGDWGGLNGFNFRIDLSMKSSQPLEIVPVNSDITAPVITGPGNLTREATGPTGAAVTFTATAVDDKDGPVAVVAIPASGSTFPLGSTTVDLGASDAAGNVAHLTFSVTVRDTTPPVITAPSSITAEATSSAGAAVSFAATAADLVSGSVSVTAAPASGSTFPIGTSTASLSATDAAGNTANTTIIVKVQDTIAPALTAPANQTLEATSAAGAAATFSATATDAVGVTSLTYSAASGSTFPLGTTTVTVTAKDAAGNTSTGSFTITVKDTTAPALTVPASIVAEATSASGAAVSYPAASATDAVGVTSLTYSAASGSTFPLGTTTVTVTAKDAAGNTSTGSFTITVKDTTAPALTVPANIVAEATSASGAAVSYPTATATDAVGVTSLTYSAASGSTFALGATTVTVTAKDAAGNTSTGSFTITVRDTTAPTLTSVTPSTGTLWPPNHQMVPITLTAISTDLVGVAGYVVTAISSEPDNGLGDGDTANDIQITGSGTLAPVVNLRAERAGNGNGRTYTITVQAKDAAGNLSAPKTTTVFVPKSQGGKK
jgi:hypothetical protein